MHNHLHDIACILSSTGALLAAVPPVNSSRPAIKNATSENIAPEITASELYVAPGTQYGNAQEALAHMVHELRNPERNAYNGTLDFTYATLSQLLDMLRDPIYQHGLMLDQSLVRANDATDSLPFNMVTTFRHIPTNTEVSFSLPAYLRQDKRLDECQQFGATYTYYRRYGLRQALGITDGDDDADQAEAKRSRRNKRNAPAKPDALHDEVMTWLPDVTAPGWKEAEAKAIALGATPYTEEQIQQAWENARTFKKLTPEECQFLNVTFELLAGDYTSVNPVWQKYKAVLDQRALAGEIRIVDQEDLSRGYFRCWLLAAQEFAGVPVSVLCEDDEPEQEVCSEPSVTDDQPPEETARLQRKRDKRKEDIRAGTVSNSNGDYEDDAVCDALYAQVKSGLSPQPPIKREYVDAPLVDIPESEIPY